MRTITQPENEAEDDGALSEIELWGEESSDSETSREQFQSQHGDGSRYQ